MKSPGTGKTVPKRIARTEDRIGKGSERIVRKERRRIAIVRKVGTPKARSGNEEIIGIKAGEKDRVSKPKRTERRVETRMETKAETREKGSTDTAAGRNRTRRGMREIKRWSFLNISGKESELTI